MNIQPGKKITFKNFNYCKRNLHCFSNPENYDIRLPDEAEKYFRYKFVTIKSVLYTEDGLHFWIEEDGNKWSYHIDWIKTTSILPEHLFKI